MVKNKIVCLQLYFSKPWNHWLFDMGILSLLKIKKKLKNNLQVKSFSFEQMVSSLGLYITLI